MGKIIELSQLVANQIAAGEVVERPVSVVKELVENSLDAGAKNIEVRIKNGGLTHLVVEDDGSGMDQADLELSIKRFATSKITSADDLSSLNSFGFRGEALPSIAAISNLVIISRQQESSYGSKAIINAGVISDMSKSSAEPGTRTEVRDLFFNVPARLKFIKSKGAESAAIDKLLRGFAFVNPGIAFKFFSDDRLVFSFASTDESDARRAVALLGKDSEGYIYYLDRSTSLVRVSGAICAPMLTRNDARSINIFVNNRLVSDRRLQGAIKAAFRTLLEVGKSPICAIKITLAPEQVDVNVHPRKAEVRFAEEPRVLSHIIRSIADFLSQTPWLSNSSLLCTPLAHSKSTFFPHSVSLPLVANSHSFAEHSAREHTTYDFLLRDPKAYGAAPSVENDSLIAQKKLLAAQKFSELRVIGQVQTTYLLLESHEGLVLIDQHAAHERVVFERLRARKNQHQASSPLLIPINLDLEFSDMALAVEHLENLRAMGFDLEPFGESSLIIRAVPDAIAKENTGLVIKDLLSELSSLGRAERFDKIYDNLCATMACHASIRAGQRLSPSEISALLVDLDSIDFGAHCPHGRPVVKSFAESEMKKWFDRT